MKTWLKKHLATLNSLANLAVVIGLALGGTGLYNHYHHVAATPSNTTDIAATAALPEEQLAIENAIKNGQRDFSFTTGFIPGIGYISDPAAYQKSVQEQLQQQVNILSKQK